MTGGAAVSPAVPATPDPLVHHGDCFICGHDNPAALGPRLEGDGEHFVTANLSLDYLAPALIGEELDLVASLTRSEGRKRWVEVVMSRGEQRVAAAQLLFVTVEVQHFEDLGVAEDIDVLFGAAASRA